MLENSDKTQSVLPDFGTYIFMRIDFGSNFPLLMLNDFRPVNYIPFIEFVFYAER